MPPKKKAAANKKTKLTPVKEEPIAEKPIEIASVIPTPKVTQVQESNPVPKETPKTTPVAISSDIEKKSLREMRFELDMASEKSIVEMKEVSEIEKAKIIERTKKFGSTTEDIEKTKILERAKKYNTTPQSVSSEVNKLYSYMLKKPIKE